MQNKLKNIIITVGFIIILISVFLINIFSKDKEISTSERRKLTQFPEITFENLVNGKAIEEFQDYTVDQFIARDFFRGIKSFFSINIFKQQDNNSLFINNNAIYKMEYPLNENNIEKSANKINEVYNKYLQNMNVYYAIIPDKNYYLENDNHLKLDYNVIEQIMNNKLSNLNYIDIKDSLKLDDYYKTDLHWRQENLHGVVNTIQKNINLNIFSNNYEKVEIGDFYGTYYGQLGINLPADKMYILTNDIIQNCSTYNFETQKTDKIYTLSDSADKYDVFLSGATPLITIENPNSTSQKELLLFRDSFGSSIAPLFVENYNKITLIDLRYISSQLLDNYINFNDQDVLFLYSTLILNQNILK